MNPSSVSVVLFAIEPPAFADDVDGRNEAAQVLQAVASAVSDVSGERYPCFRHEATRLSSCSRARECAGCGVRRRRGSTRRPSRRPRRGNVRALGRHRGMEAGTAARYGELLRQAQRQQSRPAG